MINWIKRCFRYVFSFVGVFIYIGATASEKATRLGRWLYEDMSRWIFGASVAFMCSYIVLDWLLFGSPFWKRHDG
tara:strand:- start:78 stop:302 length:225 start_codon:yes stop_codon:yes gene_type:complete